VDAVAVIFAPWVLLAISAGSAHTFVQPRRRSDSRCSLVAITDALAATSLAVDGGDRGRDDAGGDRDDRDADLETFVTLQAARSGQVFRGVAFAAH
jgi:hypothetical protein